MHEEQELPVEIEGMSESIYAGFWSRIGSGLLDALFTIPVVILILYINAQGLSIYYYTIIPSLLFTVWYHVYLPSVYGGTPGKLIVGIAIVRLDGQSIDGTDALLRYSVTLFLSILGIIVAIVSLYQADEKIYMSLSWLQRAQYLNSLSPVFFKFNMWVSNLWFYSEFIVLLMNPRRRALHDLIAGTVVIKAKYFEKIDEVMGLNGVKDS
jgi:uncharacterized RDD family membrane protein YckC